jgi:hypothetical protein
MDREDIHNELRPLFFKSDQSHIAEGHEDNRERATGGLR